MCFGKINKVVADQDRGGREHPVLCEATGGAACPWVLLESLWKWSPSSGLAGMTGLAFPGLPLALGGGGDTDRVKEKATQAERSCSKSSPMGRLWLNKGIQNIPLSPFQTENKDSSNCRGRDQEVMTPELWWLLAAHRYFHRRDGSFRTR